MLKTIIYLAIAVLFAIFGTAYADCPANINVQAGDTLTLTSDLGPTGYYYDWGCTGVTQVSATDSTNVFSVQVGGCDVTPKSVTLYMRPTGTTDTNCVYECTIPITCSQCNCPDISGGCLSNNAAPTWTYTCPAESSLLFDEWWIQTNAATTILSTDTATWGTRVETDSKTYIPASPYLPTSSSPSITYRVIFAVRSDGTDTDALPDTVVKFCTPVQVTLYWDPTATVTSSIA